MSPSSSENIPALVSVGMVSEDTLLNRFLRIFGFDDTNENYTGTTKALMYVKTIINLLLSLVSFVALGIILYSFYLMFFTEDTKGIETVKKNLIGVAIALVILGLSWFIVSFIFNLYNRISCPEGQTRSESEQQCTT
ncbi:MAG: hypothetical protein LBD75_00325 [Candidatus Peribacteria bacterium]|jgi:uncharacterized membrane protein|nr:hypothetical protein [Candidatus Peribacteria bacterium]